MSAAYRRLYCEWNKRHFLPVILLLRFDYLHKRQSGEAGQYGRVIGHLEPLTGEDLTSLEFEDRNKYSQRFHSSHGFFEVCKKGMRPRYLDHIKETYDMFANRNKIIFELPGNLNELLQHCIYMTSVYITSRNLNHIRDIPLVT